MKKYFFAIAILISAIKINAQTEMTNDTVKKNGDQMQTVFGAPGKLGWWASPDFAWTQIDNRDAFLCGLSGGVIINHSFSIGLAGYGIVNSQHLSYSGILDTADVYLYGGYGGLKLEYRMFPMKMVHLAFPLLIGGGGAVFSTWEPDDWYDDYHEHLVAYSWDSYFVMEPGVVVGINMLKFMRLDIGASYRYAPGVNLPKTDSDMLTGLNLITSIKFGKF